MIKPIYTEWEHIFLDTCIIIDYLHAKRNPGHATRADYVKKILDDLLTKKTASGANRKFYVSAITISELLDKSDDKPKAERLVKQLNASDLTYVAFDNDIAGFMTANYHAILGTDKLRAISRELSWPEHDLVLAREWVSKDLMIIASAHSLDCDVVLTVDWKTFYPVAEKVDCFCALVLEDNFNISPSGANIFAYEPTNYGKSSQTQEAAR
ncbi:MAG: PIN domain-containing protein [Bacteroidetes bacterium]|nr:PIN domain-containing protein [Bacteroidota bacterium]